MRGDDRSSNDLRFSTYHLERNDASGIVGKGKGAVRFATRDLGIHIS